MNKPSIVWPIDEASIITRIETQRKGLYVA